MQEIVLENIKPKRDGFLPLSDIFYCDGDKNVSAGQKLFVQMGIGFSRVAGIMTNGDGKGFV